MSEKTYVEDVDRSIYDFRYEEKDYYRTYCYSCCIGLNYDSLLRNGGYTGDNNRN